jgi:hypothetical protein
MHLSLRSGSSRGALSLNCASTTAALIVVMARADLSRICTGGIVETRTTGTARRAAESRRHDLSHPGF